ncbi:MAG: TetR/AcrR family transcriptional regulator [Candidatus Marinimicrobia bacterium]|jgi:AcrR family transcriptional regulator|nr:TetR/AcrR family transcriptional regulator [Candidatus Neomarinimicrobiota bacterium]
MAVNLPKEERQSQILDAAMKVITRKGFSNARMDDIVQEAGLSKGAIYHHYEGKKDLFLALIDHWETQTFPDFYSRNGKERSAADTLKDFAGEIIKVFKTRSYVFQAEVEFWSLANQDNEVRKRSQELYEKIINLFELVINKGIRQGEFLKVDSRITAIYILSVFQGINWFCIFNDKKINAKNYIQKSIELTLNGLAITKETS